MKNSVTTRIILFMISFFGASGIMMAQSLSVSLQNSTNVSCFGWNDGAASVIVSGGTTPYTYDWTPGNPTGDGTASVTNLTSGTYSCTVTDNVGAVVTQTVTITEPAPVSVNITSTNLVCGNDCNGTATANPSGGTGTYNYVWNPPGATSQSAIQLCAGSYTCTVTTSAGCTGTASVNITSLFPAFNISTSQHTNVTCFGACNGTATEVASGGTAPFTYSWSNGATTSSVTNLCAGNNVVTVTDADGCSLSQTVTITQPPQLSVSITHTDATCYQACNGTATAHPVGGTGIYTYNWSPAGTGQVASNMCPGTWTCTVSSPAGCTATATVLITQPPPMTVSISSVNATCDGNCNGSATATPSGGALPYTYFWTPSVGSNPTASGLCAGTYTCNVSDANGCAASGTVNIISLYPSVNLSVAHVNIGCYNACDGSVTLSTSGGTAPFSYLWSNNATDTAISNLCPGNYSATVTDANGCTDMIAATITQPTQVIPFFASTPPSCNGGCNATITDQTYGGTLPYTNVWSPSYPTCAGNYSCLVTDANGCDTLWSLTIIDPPVLSASVTVVNTTCGYCNGSASVTATGGTPPYSYAWSDGSTAQTDNNMCAGIYSVHVTDANGCTSTIVITIPNSPGPVAVPTGIINVTCNGACDGGIIESVSGGTPPYTYLWQPGNMTTSTISNLCAACYTVTVTDSTGCVFTNSVCVTEPQVLVAFANGTDATTATSNDGTLTGISSGGTPPYWMSWQPGNLVGASQGGIAPGTYTLTVCDSHNCCDTASITIGDLSGIRGYAPMNSISIFPNPAAYEISIGVNDASQFTLYNSVGEIVLSQQLKPGVNAVNVRELANGIYSAEIFCAGMREVKKVTIMR